MNDWQPCVTDDHLWWWWCWEKTTLHCSAVMLHNVKVVKVSDTSWCCSSMAPRWWNVFVFLLCCLLFCISLYDWWNHSCETLSQLVDILNYLLNPAQRGKCEFVMEVTDKTRADVKVLFRSSVACVTTSWSCTSIPHCPPRDISAERIYCTYYNCGYISCMLLFLHQTWILYKAVTWSPHYRTCVAWCIWLLRTVSGWRSHDWESELQK